MISSQSLLRKFERKLRKCMHTVEKDTGIMCSTTPTKNIAICNAGLTTGLSEEIIVEYFCAFGHIEKIVMPPGKSCSFLTFSNESEACQAFENLNGKANIGQDKKPIYLAFSEKVPETLHSYESKYTLPPGLLVFQDFVSEAEENDLLTLLHWDENTNSAVLKHRQVLHFGYEFRYDINNVDKNVPLSEAVPENCAFLFKRLGERDKNFANFFPDQLTVNKYNCGQGIPPHVDTHSAFEDPILSLSLGSSINMEFRKGDNGAFSNSVFLPRRSLLVMSGQARYLWTHGITPRKSDIIVTENGLKVEKRQTRVSFTFRKVLQGECHCNFTKLCDSFTDRQRKNQSVTELQNDEKVARDLESKHVHDVYEKIASHFSDTRHKPWPNVLDFVLSFDTGSILIDVGCGNGKYLGHNSNMFEIGCDRSFNLIDVCNNRGFEVFTCNCLNVPICDNCVDGAISIAVIHHLANEGRRLQAIKEIIRVLRQGGRALIYVWAKDQQKAAEKSAYLKQDRKKKCTTSEEALKEKSVSVNLMQSVCLPVHTNRTQFVQQDMLVPWKLKNNEEVLRSDGGKTEQEIFLRFYHVFEEGELEKLCQKVGGNVRIVKSYYDQGNWCVILEKLENN